MIPAVEFIIYTENSTIRGNAGIYAPAKEDSRVLNKEYKLQVTSGYNEILGTGSCISGSIKCFDLNDVKTVCNNLITLVKNNNAKINKGSFIGIHYCNQVEEGKKVKPCTLEVLWSN